MPSIKKLIAKGLKKQKILGITSSTLTLYTPGTRDPSNPAAGTRPTETAYPCKAFVDTTGRFMDGTLVSEGRSKLSVLGGTLPNAVRPKPGAKIVRDDVTYRVHRVVSDPVDAMHECEVSS
jgi:hypothetical protein